MLWVETPSNPLMKITDIAALAERSGTSSVRRSSSTTRSPSPYLQNPLALGADVVVHSTTKYLGGHSDVLGGALVLNDGELAEKLAFLQFGVGAVSGPMDAWLDRSGHQDPGGAYGAALHQCSGDRGARWSGIRSSLASTTRGCRIIPVTSSPVGR